MFLRRTLSHCSLPKTNSTIKMQLKKTILNLEFLGDYPRHYCSIFFEGNEEADADVLKFHLLKVEFKTINSIYSLEDWKFLSEIYQEIERQLLKLNGN